MLKNSRPYTLLMSSISRVALLGLIGTIVEWYDYYLFIYAALLAFPTLFFPSKSYLISMLASVSSYAIAFFARPLGATVFGHIGDRLGRRHALSFDLVLVGIAMISVGLMPTYATIGIIAPVAIFAFRFLQGLGVGGEWGGVATWVSEHATSKRALITSLIEIASPIGFIGAATVLLAFSKDFVTIGWRIGFLVGGSVAFLGAFLRYLATESLPFEKIKSEGKISKVPSIEVFKYAWKPIILLMLAIGGVFMAVYIPATVMPSLYLKVVGKSLGYPAYINFLGVQMPITSALIYVFAIAGLVSTPIFGYLGDKLGRKASLILGDILIAAFAYPYVYGFLSGNLGLLFIMQFLIGFAAYGPYASMAAFYPESFPTKYRYSGASYGMQLAAAVEGGLMPILLVGLLGLPSQYLANSWIVTTFLALWGIISALATLGLKETKGTQLVEEKATITK
ncbi:MFS transporter [Acidianus ambivalens]|uniref:MFS transporter n=2 Tax=Acidianus ambivalens TaxID=2283 RepID=A0A650CTM2_ACIAM|nr:MFS transporter [Acidianus ambivalens]QGR21143.1 MFS transporter [Acidianus ambivalens]